MLWSFNRKRDSDSIQELLVKWQGPFSWPKYENSSDAMKMPDISGVYIFTFKHEEGFIIWGVGLTKSTKKRLAQHRRTFRDGNYTVLDVECAQRGERVEIWHGWDYAKYHKNIFEEKKSEILHGVDRQLSSTHIFFSNFDDRRIMHRVEWAITTNLYTSTEYWADLIDRGMFLKVRYTYEMPIILHNICNSKIYGLPEMLEV